jgi:hypothetical protein
MTRPLLARLRHYYQAGAASLLNQAKAANMFANSTDIGISREKIYAEFLTYHLPSKCNIFFGGALFDDRGAESKQLDIIITTDTTPQFNLFNKDKCGKAYAHVEGTLSIVSVKSAINKEELYNALNEMASIPATKSLEGRVSPFLNIKNYDDWPYKILYATSSINYETVLEHLKAFYVENPTIQLNRRPNAIHVSGEYLIVRAFEGMTSHDPITGAKSSLIPGEYYAFAIRPDLQAIVCVLQELQNRVAASAHIFFLYNQFFDTLNLLPE